MPNPQSIQNLLKQNNLDAFLVSSIPNIVYLTGFSAFSSEEREAFLLITRNNQYVFTDTRYSEAVKRDTPSYTLIERTPGILTTTQLLEVIKKEKVKTVGFESSNLTVDEFKRFTKALSQVNLVPISNFFEETRTRKEDYELTAIEKACNVGDRAFAQILKQIEEGVSETELAVELEYFIKKQNAEISFRPIVAFSENAALPHHKSTIGKRLKTNDIILFDFGARVDNYCSDMTRTVFFGKPDKKFIDMYETVLGTQQKAIDYISALCHSERAKRLRNPMGSLAKARDDIHVSDVDKVARDYIVSKGYPSMPHSLGHGIGVEVHEAPHISPSSDEMLQEGMVFSIEPGIYIPDFGGVRIEDLAVIEKGSLRLLTNAPKNLTVIPNT